jgi:hypothetical protein
MTRLQKMQVEYAPIDVGIPDVPRSSLSIDGASRIQALNLPTRQIVRLSFPRRHGKTCHAIARAAARILRLRR